MPKWMLFGLLGAGELVIAALIYFSSGRVVIPAVLALSGVFFLVGAAQAKAKGQ